MPNQTMPADQFGHNHRDMGSDHASETQGAESTFREKAQEYIGGHRVQEIADAATEGMNATTDYLRNTGPAQMRADVEKLVKSNPGPAIIIAATVGFLLGRGLSRH